MASRLNLQRKFEETLGSRNVYYQPPESIRLQYPAIIYKHSGNRTIHADDRNYIKINEYSVTLIDRNPESEFVDYILDYPKCRLDRVFTSDNLNHWVFTIYF